MVKDVIIDILCTVIAGVILEIIKMVDDDLKR